MTGTKVYSNSATDYMVVETDIQNVAFELYDLNGKHLLFVNLDNLNKINVFKLPNGIKVAAIETIPFVFTLYE